MARLSTVQREKRVISLIKANPQSVASLVDQTGEAYYTIRRILNDLAERGIIVYHSTVDKRKFYSFNKEQEDEFDTIPRVVNLIDKRTIKIIYMLEAVGKEDGMRSTIASKSLPMHLTRLMDMAHRSSNGENVRKELDEERKYIQEDFLFLKNAAYILEQILKEPRFWNTSFLAEMAKDPDFNFAEVQKAVDYYDGPRDSA